ncbi:MAG: hypothetical protein KDA05_07500 [Phycisphaerales bacterium]|nr:hypothetical protein [Phycisphaerales bacterium]
MSGRTSANPGVRRVRSSSGAGRSTADLAGAAGPLRRLVLFGVVALAGPVAAL